jgi:hypothetical protein
MDSVSLAPTMAGMETKKKAGAAVVTEGAVQAALRRGPVRELSPDEERVMRMRLGASPPRSAPLERAAEADSDLDIELRSYEIEAYLKWRERAAAAAPAPAPRAAVRPQVRPQPSRTKDKIVRALRKKV